MTPEQLEAIRARHENGDADSSDIDLLLAYVSELEAERDRFREVADQCMRLCRDINVDTSTVKGWLESDAGVKLKRIVELEAEVERLRQYADPTVRGKEF